jgi:hypothetical protein
LKYEEVERKRWIEEDKEISHRCDIINMMVTIGILTVRIRKMSVTSMMITIIVLRKILVRTMLADTITTRTMGEFAATAAGVLEKMTVMVIAIRRARSERRQIPAVNSYNIMIENTDANDND